MCYLVSGEPRTCFLRVVDLLDGKAVTIEQKLLDICSWCKIPIGKVFGFGSDGAATMAGRRTGVAP